MRASSFLRWSGYAVAGVGIAFLGFVAAAPVGLVQPYPDPPREAVTGPLGLAARIADPQSLYRRAGEALPAYFERLTTTVAGGIVHYWTDGETWTAADAPHTGVSMLDNYLLWLHRFAPETRHFENYEFMTPAKAIARGYGFCSQVSKLVYSVLRDQGIEAKIYNNPIHAVVVVSDSILDPDYGVFIPHPIAWLQEEPARVSEYYARYEAEIPVLRRAYAAEWTQLGTDEGFASVRAYEARFERLKWAPPLLMIAGGFALAGGSAYYRRRRAGAEAMPAGGLPYTPRRVGGR